MIRSCAAEMAFANGFVRLIGSALFSSGYAISRDRRAAQGFARWLSHSAGARPITVGKGRVLTLMLLAVTLHVRLEPVGGRADYFWYGS